MGMCKVGLESAFDLGKLSLLVVMVRFVVFRMEGRVRDWAWGVMR